MKAGLTFQVGWRQTVPPGRCGRHAHVGLEIVYHVRGRGVSIVNGEEWVFGPGSVELIPAGARHDQRQHTEGEDLCVHLVGGPAVQCCRHITLAQLTDDCARVEIVALCEAHPHDAAERQDVSDHRAAAMLLAVLAEAEHVDREGDLTPAEQYAEAARRHIRENCASIERMEDVAEAVGVSHDYLRHVFRERFGMSLKNWLIESRSERARTLLTHSTLPLKAVARMCGFANERHFSTTFRRVVGVPPGQYRRQAARD